MLFETPSHSELIEKIGVRSMISDTIDELMQLAKSSGCDFDATFKDSVIQKMIQSQEGKSIMYMDYESKRPMEVETYLGSPIKLAQEIGVKVPRIETLYALLHHCNAMNPQRAAASASPSPAAGPGQAPPPPRMSSNGPPRPPMNGGMNGGMNGNGMRGGRTSSMGGGSLMRRGGGPGMNGYPPRQSNGYNMRGAPNQLSRRPSFEGDDLGEFSHLVLYDDIPEGAPAPNYGDMSNGGGPNDIALRERELAIRQRELDLREREQGFKMRRGGNRRAAPSRGDFDDDDDDDDFFDPMAGGPGPMTNPNADVDMMSVTSKRNRRVPSHSQMRSEMMGERGGSGRPGGMRQSHSYGARVRGNRASAQLLDSSIPGMGDDLLSNPMMGYSSNRYGNVDRREMATESRTNSLTAARLSELQGAGNNAGMNGAYPSPMPRRTSHSPGNPFNGNGRNMGRPSPPEHDYNGAGSIHPAGGPSPPGLMRQPVPRHPPGQGNAVAPQQVEQYAGVSNLYPPKGPVQKTVRSLTGSASASAGSGDSAQAESDPSAHSSQSSLAPRLNAARYPAGNPLHAH